MHRRTFLLGGIAATALAHRPAHAILGIDCGGVCSNLWEQILQLEQQVQSYATQIQQLYAEVQTYMNTAWMLVSLPTSLISTVTGDLNMIRGLASAGSLLTGNAGSLISRLQSVGGYAGTLAMTPTMLTNQFNMWSTTIGQAGNNLGRLLDQSGLTHLTDAASQHTAELHSAAAVGTLQALQAGNEQAAIISKNMLAANETLTGMAQEAATRDAVNADRDAMRDNATQEYLQHNDFGWSAQERY